jgi:ankyrin repeat protein
MLIAAGANVTSQTKAGDAALHWAAYHGDHNLVTAILDAEADMEEVGDLGNKAIHLAAAGNHKKVRGSIHILV